MGTADAIQILKKWRGVANEGEMAVIAVRTGSPMSACEWQHEDDDETYRFESGPWSNRINQGSIEFTLAKCMEMFSFPVCNPVGPP